MSITKKTRVAGMYERHLLRRQDNNLYPETDRQVTAEQISHARDKDQAALERFQADFSKTLQKAVDLKPNSDSEPILGLKEELDQFYQLCCTLPGDFTEAKQAIRSLITKIMKEIWKGVGNDNYAQQQLHDEEIAREIHFKLQENLLVADLTSPLSPVRENDLIPTLLSEESRSFAQVLEIFDAEQLSTLLNSCVQYLEQHDSGQIYQTAWQNLSIIRDRLQHVKPETINN